MNPLDLLSKLMDNPRTSGGAIVIIIGIWLATTYATDPAFKYVGLGILCVGVIMLGFGAADAKNVVTKSEMADKPASKPATFGELAEGAPPGPKPLQVEIVKPHEETLPPAGPVV